MIEIDAYVGEIGIFAFNRVPMGWRPCNGDLLKIVDYQALYALIGTTYGGNGQDTFALPDLRGRVIVHQAPARAEYRVGQAAGLEGVALSVDQIPPHSHSVYAVSSTQGNNNSPLDNFLSQATANIYARGSSVTQPLHASSIQSTGGGLPHENRQPSLALLFCIAVVGIFPSRPF